MTWPDRSRSARTFDGVEYAPGRKYRVVREGMRLSGWVPAGPSCMGGWSQALHVDDVIECTGFGAGMGSDPGFGVEWTSEEAKGARASHCDLYPVTGGVFSYRPVAGSVEPIEES